MCFNKNSMSQEENKKDGYAGWRRFRNRVNIGLIIIALIILYASFYFVGPISGKVVDAKTDEPIANIKVGYYMRGDDLLCFNPGGCTGWGNDLHSFTNDKGIFKIPISTAFKIPFIMFLNSKRRLVINEYSAENKSYDRYEETFVWFPFRSFKFALVPIPETLDDCRDNLTEKEQYRCVEMLAGRDAGEVNEIEIMSMSKFNYGSLWKSPPIPSISEYSMDGYFLDKYLDILTNYCANNNDPFTYCTEVKAFSQKDKNMCNNDNYCLYIVAIDLRDKSWCKNLPSLKELKDIYDNRSEHTSHDTFYDISREICEYKIDTLTAEVK